MARKKKAKEQKVEDYRHLDKFCNGRLCVMIIDKDLYERRAGEGDGSKERYYKQVEIL